MRKTILIIVPELKNGGAPLNILNTIELLVEFDFVLVSKCFDNSINNSFQKTKNIKKIIDLNVNEISISAILNIISVVKKYNIDTIWSNGNGGLFYTFCILHNVKRVHTFRGFYVHKSFFARHILKLIYQYLYIRKTEFVCVSKSERAAVVNCMPALEYAITKISNGVKLRNLDCTQNLDKPKKRRSIQLVTIARVNRQKDIATSIKVLKYLPNSATLTILGPLQDKVYYTELMELAKEMKVSHRIKFNGALDNARQQLCKYDVYISTARFEGLPTAILEAFAEKIPVVATSCQGNVDIVPISQQAAIGNAKQLATLIEKMCASTSAELADLLALQLDIVKRFTVDECARGYSHLFNRFEAYEKDTDNQ